MYFQVSGAAFAQLRIEQFEGKNLIYSDHHSKISLDIKQVHIDNKLAPGSEAVLTYLIKPPAVSFSKYNKMVRVRIQDEFIIPYESKWKVFNQFQIFVHPVTVNATKKFYKIVKNYFFSRPSLAREDEDEVQNTNTGQTQTKIQKKKQKSGPGIPVYFKYFRLNQINALATFTGGFPNITNFEVDISSFSKKGKFRTIKKMFEKYEMFIIKTMISPKKVGQFVAHKLGIPKKQPKKQSEEERVKRLIDGKKKF